MIKRWWKKMVGALWQSAKEEVKQPRFWIGLAVAGLTLGGVSAFAEGEPLDFTATATSVVGYITTAASQGLPILAGLFGLRVMIRAFFSVAG